MKKKCKFFYSGTFLRLKLLSHKTIKNKEKYEESKRPKPVKKLQGENKQQLKLVNNPLS